MVDSELHILNFFSLAALGGWVVFADQTDKVVQGQVLVGFSVLAVDHDPRDLLVVRGSVLASLDEQF